MAAQQLALWPHRSQAGFPTPPDCFFFPYGEWYPFVRAGFLQVLQLPSTLLEQAGEVNWELLDSCSTVCERLWVSVWWP